MASYNIVILRQPDVSFTVPKEEAVLLPVLDYMHKYVRNARLLRRTVFST